MTRTIKDPRQLVLDDLYQVPETLPPLPGSQQFADDLCAALSAALKSAPCSRAAAAMRMSDLTGEDITLAMVNAWTAKSHCRHRFPFEYSAAFEVATDSTALQTLLATRRGSLVLFGDQARDARLGLVRRRIAALRAEERSLLREDAR
jgi:hypothetical protein